MHFPFLHFSARPCTFIPSPALFCPFLRPCTFLLHRPLCIILNFPASFSFALYLQIYTFRLALYFFPFVYWYLCTKVFALFFVPILRCASCTICKLAVPSMPFSLRDPPTLALLSLPFYLLHSLLFLHFVTCILLVALLFSLHSCNICKSAFPSSPIFPRISRTFALPFLSHLSFHHMCLYSLLSLHSSPCPTFVALLAHLTNLHSPPWPFLLAFLARTLVLTLSSLPFGRRFHSVFFLLTIIGL